MSYVKNLGETKIFIGNGLQIELGRGEEILLWKPVALKAKPRKLRLVEHYRYGDSQPRDLRRKNIHYKVYTLVIDGVPDYAGMTEMINDYLSGKKVELSLQSGVARTHPDDNFCKKTGFSLAVSRLWPLRWTRLVEVVINEDGFRVTLATARGCIYLYYAKHKRPIIDGSEIIY
jgi:hypothetical protein